MSIPRFYIEQSKFNNDKVIIDNPDIVNQIVRVLRLKEGDEITVFDGNGMEYEVRIMKYEVRSKKLEGEVVSKRQGIREVKRQITLYQSLLKSDKFELILQKCTEVGVRKFVPVVSKNCVVNEFSENKIKRYNEIIREATEQCGGVKLADLNKVISFHEAVKMVSKDELSLIAWEREELKITNYELQIKDATKINLFIGPEGGYTTEEIEIAKNNGIIPISLGKRILRAETAAIVASALVAI